MKLPSDCVCLHLRKAARAATRSYDEALAPFGLRGTQFSLLAMICGKKSISISELADMAVMERTTLTRNLRVMEKAKLIVSSPGQDKRKRLISLSPTGHDTLKLAIPAWRKVQGRMVKELGETRKTRLLKDLRFTAALSV